MATTCGLHLRCLRRGMDSLPNGYRDWAVEAPEAISAAHRTQHEYRKDVLFGKSAGARAEPLRAAAVGTAELFEVLLPVFSAREPVQGPHLKLSRSGCQ